MASIVQQNNKSSISSSQQTITKKDKKLNKPKRNPSTNIVSLKLNNNFFFLFNYIYIYIFFFFFFFFYLIYNSILNNQIKLKTYTYILN